MHDENFEEYKSKLKIILKKIIWDYSNDNFNKLVNESIDIESLIHFYLYLNDKKLSEFNFDNLENSKKIPFVSLKEFIKFNDDFSTYVLN